MAQRFPLFLHPSVNGSFSENLFSQKEKNDFFLKSSYKHLDFPEEKSIFSSPLTRYTTQVKAPVAQLDRASDYGSEGLGFESLRACHLHHCQQIK